MFENLRSATKLIDLHEAGCGPSVPLHEARSMHWHQRRGKTTEMNSGQSQDPAASQSEPASSEGERR